jgi:hypothetical protein
MVVMKEEPKGMLGIVSVGWRSALLGAAGPGPEVLPESCLMNGMNMSTFLAAQAPHEADRLLR